MKKLFRSRKKLLAICGVLLLLGLLATLEKMHVIDLYKKNKIGVIADGDKTTSKAPSAQENFTNGGQRQVATSDKNEGLIKDTGGLIPSIPPEDTWSVSTDKSITVYTPARNSLLESGSIVAGVSNLPRVSYRLIDDVSGVIAQGVLTVSGGKFSGSFSFSSKGTNGRLDIFNTAPNGAESSSIEIAVRFK